MSDKQRLLELARAVELLLRMQAADDVERIATAEAVVNRLLRRILDPEVTRWKPA